MYYRKTKNRILASVLLLAVVLCISLNSSGFAYTRDFYGVFSPMGAIGHGVLNSEDIINLGAILPSGDITNDSWYDDTNTGNNNRILIYHTHTNEAYLETDENRFENLAGRSSNAELTVKKVGKTLQDALAAYGFDSDHNPANNEEQGYNNAYYLSADLIESMIEQNGEYMAYIDVHRDAYIKNTVPTVTINGQSVARIMLVVGGKSDYADENYAFALKVAEELNKVDPQLCEKVSFVQSSKYNQNSDHFLLVEVGDNAVTIDEACRAVEYVAMAVAKVLNNE